MVLLTFGLLSPNKGIEHVLNALPSVVAESPNVVDIVLGATHPQELRTRGEAYRLGLEAIVFAAYMPPKCQRRSECAPAHPGSAHVLGVRSQRGLVTPLISYRFRHAYLDLQWSIEASGLNFPTVRQTARRRRSAGPGSLAEMVPSASVRQPRNKCNRRWVSRIQSVFLAFNRRPAFVRLGAGDQTGSHCTIRTLAAGCTGQLCGHARMVEVCAVRLLR
jgi:glycosyltransferase involved in cell wall biosynthesis